MESIAVKTLDCQQSEREPKTCVWFFYRKNFAKSMNSLSGDDGFTIFENSNKYPWNLYLAVNSWTTLGQV